MKPAFMKRAVTFAVLAIGAAACGVGGGGPSKDAYCSKVGDFQSVGETLEDNEDLDQAVALLKGFNEVEDAAPADIKPDVSTLNTPIQAMANALDGVDPNDEEAILTALLSSLAVFDQEEVGAAATKVDEYTNRECNIDLDLSDFGSTVGDDGTGTATTFGQPDTTAGPGGSTTTSGPETTTTTEASAVTTGSANNLPDPEPVPGGTDAQLNELAQQCHDGDMQACDDLYTESEIGSEYEAYGNSCGGRVPDNSLYCVDVYPDN
jgi:hypothetical protein